MKKNNSPHARKIRKPKIENAKIEKNNSNFGYGILEISASENFKQKWETHRRQFLGCCVNRGAGGIWLYKDEGGGVGGYDNNI